MTTPNRMVVSLLKSRSPARTGTLRPSRSACDLGAWPPESRRHADLFGEKHAIRLGLRYICCFHEDRTHLGLDKDTPDKRAMTPRPSPGAGVVALPRVGGLHHRYRWRDAA